jgi:hypothetical protein
MFKKLFARIRATVESLRSFFRPSPHVHVIVLRTHMYSSHARVGLRRTRRQVMNRVRFVGTRLVVWLFVVTVYAYALQTV